MLGIDEERYYTEKELKHNEGINFMKWAINKSDIITTVSPSYSKEVKEKYYGFGLEKVLKDKDENFLGILNGIDYNLFKVPIENGTIQDLIKYKKINKRKLQEKLNLVVDENTPIISVISRLVNQKGISLLISNIHELIDRGMEIIISGTGESYYEEVLMELESRYKGRVKTLIDFNINLANEIYLSSDLFLAPSKFEPCGLTQMISMRYGTIPIVRAVGGLKDSVKEFSFLTEKGNGFVFKEFESRDMLDSLDRALDVYRNKNLWNKVVENAFYSDNSWNKGAEKYKDIYDKLKK
jgi:starch synthase